MKQILLFFLFFTGISGFSQDLDCAKVKTGTFIKSDNDAIYTVRKETTQESFKNGTLMSVWSLKWNSPCEYEIICTDNKGSKSLAKGDRMVCKIQNIFEECHTIVTTFYNADFPEGNNFENSFCIKPTK